MTALNEQELKGCKTFMEAGCTACHSGPLLGGNMFREYPLFGTHKELTGSSVDDIGKMQFTKNEADKYMFKSTFAAQYGRNMALPSRWQRKRFDKTIQIKAKGQLNKELTPEQNSEISLFMKSLTGEIPADAKQLPGRP